MTTATTKKIRCVAAYKNGNPCRAYAVHGYLCGQHQHLLTSAEVQVKIAEIERQDAERERQFNEILAQDAHTRLHAAPALAIPASGGWSDFCYRLVGWSDSSGTPVSRLPFCGLDNMVRKNPWSSWSSNLNVDVDWADMVNKVGEDSIFRFRYAARKFTPYRGGLESQREEQAALWRLPSPMARPASWGLEVQGFVKSGLLCREMKSYGDVFPGAKREKIDTYVNCPNPRVGPSPAHRSERQCLPCQRETQAMHALSRRVNEENGACEHGPNCWPTLDAVIDLGGGRCHYCRVSVTIGIGKNTDACRDHYIPVSRGGLHCKDNVVLACRHCNGSKHDNMPPSPRETAASI